jgi:hypothetical protein
VEEAQLGRDQGCHCGSVMANVGALRFVIPNHVSEGEVLVYNTQN